MIEFHFLQIATNYLQNAAKVKSICSKASTHHRLQPNINRMHLVHPSPIDSKAVVIRSCIHKSATPIGSKAKCIIEDGSDQLRFLHEPLSLQNIRLISDVGPRHFEIQTEGEYI